ncbi:hypothetical protein VTH82DRAFT_5327 [Thermothelomyces myriococcoides]
MGKDYPDDFDDSAAVKPFLRCWDSYDSETQKLLRGCFCPRRHAAFSLACQCWAPPGASLFLVCRTLYEDAQYIFFSKNRFIVHDYKIYPPWALPFVEDCEENEAPPERPYPYERFAISHFLREVVPESSLAHLRFLELVFPPYPPSGWPGGHHPAMRDWRITVDWLIPRVNPRQLTLQLAVSDPGAYALVPYYEPITVQGAWELLGSYMNLVHPIVWLGDEGLARFYAHFPDPWQWVGELQEDSEIDALSRLMDTVIDFNECAERWVLGSRYDSLRADETEEPYLGNWNEMYWIYIFSHEDVLARRDVDRVVRIPKPTEDPADPLNWPRWQKAACMVTLSLYAFVSNYISASIAPALPRWNEEFLHDRRPTQDLMQFVAVNVLVLGLGNIFWVPLSNIFGRRLVLVLSSLLLFSATCCGIPFTSFTQTLIIRIFQGLGSSASETIVPAVVGDLFFVHERGSWMSFYTASLASGSVVGGITGGYVAAELGWSGQFWVGTALSGLTFLATVLLVPESVFDRGRPTALVRRTIPPISRAGRQHLCSTPPKLSLMTLPSMRFTLPSRFRWQPPSDFNDGYEDDEASLTCSIYGNLIDLGHHRANGNANRNQTSNTNNNANKANGFRGRNMGGHGPSSPPPPSFRAPPPAVDVHPLAGDGPVPGAGGAAYGGLVGGVAVMSTVGPQLLVAPPYRWPERRAGLLFVGALVGIVLGAACSGLAADRCAAAAAARAIRSRAEDGGGGGGGGGGGDGGDGDQGGGLVEPEARVPLLLPALLIGTCGLAVFGVCAQYPSPAGWIGLEFAFGMVSFALAQVPSIWFGYLIDAYDQLASDCFVMICILRGAIPFAWTFFVAQWIQRDGFLIPFGGFTAIMGVFSLLVIPIMCGGKRMRIATARYVSENQS